MLLSANRRQFYKNLLYSSRAFSTERISVKTSAQTASFGAIAASLSMFKMNGQVFHRDQKIKTSENPRLEHQ